MSYEERAKKILKDAIKSAVYIDEKARPFFACDNLMGEKEEQLSVDLYENFKKEGISLEVYKYEADAENDPKTMSFLLDNRDLVILDWNLKDKSGELESLKILDQVINCKHIHFCTIYTVEPKLETVLKNLLCYFSGLTKEEFDDIKEKTEILFEGKNILQNLHDINLNRNNNIGVETLKTLMKSSASDINSLKKEIGIKDSKCAIIKASLVNLLQNPHLPDEPTSCPTYVDSSNNIIVINNTIITILNKSENDANVLLDNFKNHIISDIDSFNQLLGIELYNHLFRSSAITNDSVMSFSKDALVYHRKQLKEDGIEHFFKSFMDEVLLEKISMSLRDRESLLLEDGTLNNFESALPQNYNDIDALHKMNVFYNSYYFDKKGKILNFGDVFLVEHKQNHKEKPKYLICITALCDCLNPQDKIKNNFYFAEGTNISKQDAIGLGETAFISFLPNNITIKWTEVAKDELRKKFSPIYIKPLQYKVFEGKNRIDENNEIQIHYLDKTGTLQTEKLKYLGTIRPNYTQRIANHAFAYPIRVGVDFVKI